MANFDTIKSLGKFQANNKGDIMKLDIIEFQGKPAFQARVFFLNLDGDLQPGKSGIIVRNAKQLAMLDKAIQSAKKIVD